MNHTPVSSSNLSSVGYDEATKTLEITFHKGGTYQYSGVPASVYQSLIHANSVGSYFHDNIKDVYPTRKIR
jgi:hypothetical protein